MPIMVERAAKRERTIAESDGRKGVFEVRRIPGAAGSWRFPPDIYPLFTLGNEGLAVVPSFPQGDAKGGGNVSMATHRFSPQHRHLRPPAPTYLSSFHLSSNRGRNRRNRLASHLIMGIMDVRYNTGGYIIFSERVSTS
ncbi:Hypothetical protein NTJ_11655 [Nesidiocoris tenuis]|uniref:Uncharacterized protein n=1 Tax=Nesidiocoris tenuis TaxID=355587 RepID=A0ABN7B3P0_9HEMI|nr:Hypothetical protein NTJ_11655 [Nesidiocoris tenuis]